MTADRERDMELLRMTATQWRNRIRAIDPEDLRDLPSICEHKVMVKGNEVRLRIAREIVADGGVAVLVRGERAALEWQEAFQVDRTGRSNDRLRDDDLRSAMLRTLRESNAAAPLPAWVQEYRSTGTSPLWLASGYFVELVAHPDEDFQHIFCGTNDTAGAECPNCRRPMLRQLLLDGRDRRLQLDRIGVERLPLLFCWTCPLSLGTAYRVEPDGSVELLRFSRGEPAADFPYSEYPTQFPKAFARLDPVPHQIGERVAAMNAGIESIDDPDDSTMIPRHQLGGEPYFVQGRPFVRCSVCKRPAAILASIGDMTVDGRGFTGNAFVQTWFALCGPCRVVRSGQMCD
ncbi:MAG: hypothetical protein U1F36_20860 [Planctomycetota bacterium]